MLVGHHLGLSQSERVVWLCEELDIDYTLKRYDRREDNRLAPEEYKSLHPMGIAPVIFDGDLVLGESAAICDYIGTRYAGGRLTPVPDDATYPDYLFWFHWSNATYMTTRMIAMGIAFSGGDSAKVPFVTDRMHRSEELIEQRLGDVPFFAGLSLTLADIMMVIRSRPRAPSAVRRRPGRTSWHIYGASPSDPPISARWRRRNRACGR